MRVVTGLAVTLALLACASAARGPSRGLQQVLGGVATSSSSEDMMAWSRRRIQETDPEKDKPELNKPGKDDPMVPPGDKPGKPGMPDPDNNSTCPDKWYLDNKETHECVCDQLKKCNITGLQGPEGPRGMDGMDGFNGTDGAPGRDGRPGLDDTCDTCPSGQGFCAGLSQIITSQPEDQVDQAFCESFYATVGVVPGGTFACNIARCPEGSRVTGGSCTSTGNGSPPQQSVLFSLGDGSSGIACSPRSAAGGGGNNGAQDRIVAQAVCCARPSLIF